jgi:hypothetical protein
MIELLRLRCLLVGGLIRSGLFDWLSLFSYMKSFAFVAINRPELTLGLIIHNRLPKAGAR